MRTIDLVRPETLRFKIAKNVERINRAMTGLDSVEAIDPEVIFKTCLGYGDMVRPYLRDTSRELNDRMDRGASVLFEGAQGTLLDLDHGTYPYVTSSSATVGGLCTGLGVGPRRIDGVLGILKAYCTRVGEGPFPSEMPSEIGDFVRVRGNEFGASTGRPRRCGWFDAAAASYSLRVNGATTVAVTLFDVLDELDTLKICVAYTDGSVRYDALPADLPELEHLKPEFIEVPGWKTPTGGVTRFDDLPVNARRYLQTIEKLTGARIALVSVGPERTRNVVVPDSDLARWTGTTGLS